MYIACLMLLPLAIGLVTFIISQRPGAKGNLSILEFACLEAVCLVIFGGGYSISRWNAVHDVEIVSGVVTSKQQVIVTCSHSYKCRCHEVCTGSGKERSCTEECDTCYDHSNDYDWMLYTNAMGESIKIARVDAQGAYEPPRYAKVLTGDPVALQHSFANYIKADSGSVLRRRGVKDFPGLPLPAYPNETWDYYHINRFIQIGTNDQNAAYINKVLMSMNGNLGPHKQANVILVTVRTKDPTYEYLVEERWLKGKKNDVIVLIGASEYPKIDWVRIISWTQQEDFKIALRDKLMSVGTLHDPNPILSTIHTLVFNGFKRRSFKDFEYMMASVQPGTGATIFLFLLGMAVCIGLTAYFYANDPFGGRPLIRPNVRIRTI